MTMAAWVLGLTAAVALPDRCLAQERVSLGWGGITVNDSLGDAHDRWRTGSLSISQISGPGWNGALPAGFGEILEFRARAEIVAPANLTVQSPFDRRYAGLLSFGLHTHFQPGQTETSLGIDLVMTGPQTGLDKVQAAIHRVLNYPPPDVADLQIPNHAYLTVVAEFARSIDLGPSARLRPFAEIQAGVETFARVGLDLCLGQFSQGGLMIREPVSGHRYRTIAGNQASGLTFTLGGDVAYVHDSALFLDGGAVKPLSTRTRVRTGLAWHSEKVQVFYGLTWLGREFNTQPEGQLVGALSLRLKF